MEIISKYFLKKPNYLKVFFIFLLVFFLNSPNFNQLFKEDTWQVHLDKADNLFLNIDTDKPWSHNSKLNHRILAPLFVKVFHLNLLGLFILQLISTFWFFQMLYILLEKEFKVNTNSIFYTLLSLGFTYLGVCGTSESKAIFDIFSFSLCLTGFNYRRHFGIFATTTFLSLLNDERSIFTAVGFIILGSIIQGNKSYKGYFNRISCELCFSICIYILYRYYMHLNGVITHSGGISLSLFFKQINAMPFVYFSFFEGLLIVYLFIYYQRNNLITISDVINRFKIDINISFLLVYLITTLTVFVVYDLNRSMNYFFPLIIMGLFFLKKVETHQYEFYSKLLLFINIIIPTYSMWGPYEIYKTFPIPLQILKSLLL